MRNFLSNMGVVALILFPIFAVLGLDDPGPNYWLLATVPFIIIGGMASWDIVYDRWLARHDRDDKNG
jgi:glycopeptide antibiotics resistance protein